VLQACGFRTGVYTSPHFLDFRERIRIDGACISEKEVIDFVESNQPLFEEIKPSFFEMTVAMAFAHFDDCEVDFAVIETGLGGRLDSTNIVDPVLSVITNVAMDHQEFLGDTLPQIAAEKAGIIKSGRPVILGIDDPAYRFVIDEKSDQMNAPMRIAQDEVSVSLINQDDLGMHLKIDTRINDLPNEVNLPLHGLYQIENVATVLCTIDQLRKEVHLELTSSQIRVGLESRAVEHTLLGRWQLLCQSPRVIADGAHNIAAIREVVKNLRQENYQQLHIVIGFSGDKNYEAILSLLPQDATYYFCRAQSHRALPLDLIKKYATQIKLNASYHEEVDNALSSALQEAQENELIFIGGSIYIVAEAMHYLK